MTVYEKITEIIGNTPLLRMPLRNKLWKIYIKLEKFNPGQSMKDRMALNMVTALERDGRLKRGATLIESSSGNTATGLAIVAAERGYRFIAVVDHHASKEKIDTIRAYGGKIIFVGTNNRNNEVAVAEREQTALRLSRKLPGSFFLAQANNLHNREAYVHTLGKELVQDLNKIDILIGALGTGGSLSGTAQYLKRKNKQTKVIAIEPVGSTLFKKEGGHYFQSGTGNPPGAAIPLNINYALIDQHAYVSDQEAFNTCRFFARHNGVLLGGSAGGVLFKALRMISRLSDTKKKGGTVVALMPDGGEKYMSTIYNDAWMQRNNLLDKTVDQKLEKLI